MTLPAAPPWVLGLLVAGIVIAGLGFGQAGVRPSVAARLWPVARVVLRWLALPVALVLTLPALGDDVRMGLVAAMLVVAGWFLTFLFQIEEREIDLGDLMVALRAEIWVYLLALRRDDTASYARDLDARLAAAVTAGKDYQHFVPIPGDPVVFKAVAERIDRLPTAPVDRVIQFYSLITDIRGFAEDLRTAAFAALPLDRRRAAYGHYYAMRMTLEVLATLAIRDINLALGVADPTEDLDGDMLAADQPPPVNSPVPAPSAPESEPDSSVGPP